MKTSQIVLIAVLTSFAASALATTLMIRSSQEASAAEPELSVDPTEERIASLEKSRRELLETIDSLRSQLNSERVSADENSAESDLETLVAAAVAKLAAEGKLGMTSSELAEEESKLNIAAHALELLRDDLTDEERQALWAAAHESGQAEELLAWFEARAKDNPTDADAQSDLGNALLQSLFVVPEGPLKGQLAMRADAAFDSALAIDDHHWEARFSKAVSLSFWPAVLGKQQEAINHFETLVSQQAGQAAHDGFASTHLLLGNMYEQVGQTEQAMAAWQAGAGLFPDDTGLAEQIAAHQQD